MERNKLRLSVPDHSYSSKKVCSNRNLSTTASSIKETSVTTLNTTEKDISNTSEIESNLTDNENYDIVLNSSDVFTNTAEKDISNTSEIESNLIDNENSDIVLNNSDVFTNTCTIASSNASNILPEMIMEVENAITAETIEEQQIDIMTASLKNENEQLKKELARVKKIADKIHQENNTLRKSNKNLRRRNEILTNIQEKSESILTKFNKDQKKAMYKKNYRGIHWEPITLKQALILKLKCGSSGYKEVQKQIPLPSIRTLQRRIKHIEFRPGFLEETLHLLADQINHNKEEWKDCVLALDEMSIQPGEMIDPNTNESIGRTTLASHSGVANKALVFLLGGIIFGWKQVICFHLTGSKAKDAKEGVTGQVYADIIKNIIERCETIGLRIHCVVSDMGSDNRTLNKNNEEAYKEAISHLKVTMRTFSGMCIGVDSRWKPVQCGVTIATSAILDLQEYFLNERGFKFLLTGRFTQDFLENLFSCIRFRQPIPHALMFKNILKAISVAQFCTIDKSNYDADDGEMILDFLAKSKCTQYKDPKLNLCIEIPILTDENISYFSKWERLVLYDMAGSTLRSVKNVYSICNTCYNALLWQEKEPHPYVLLTRLNAYKDDCLTQVSEEAFKAIWKAELTFRIVRENLLRTQKVNIYDILV
ncbi:unnamed protein product [Lasius platythorax]|uniref:Transposable element P transposase-like RNase H domain-containing protein n=1 Tax=Lasius platythorax TaxID=488582 RepID=A0AAV2MXM5_9HYME